MNRKINFPSLNLARAITLALTCHFFAIGADEPKEKADTTDTAVEAVALKNAYNQTRINGFFKLHQSHLQDLARILEQQLKAGDLAGANLVNAEIELVKSRMELLGKGEVIPVPISGDLADSEPATVSRPAALETAVATHRSVLQKGVDQLNLEYVAKIVALQKQFMARADLPNANALEIWKAELSRELPNPAGELPNTSLPNGNPDGVDLLAPEQRKHWVEERGIWTFRENALKGAGDSHIIYSDSVRPPFTLAFDMNVEKGSRPRVYVGRHTIGNDGYNFQLILHPRDPKQKVFPYKNGETVPVKLIVNRRFLELHVGGELIDRREPGLENEIDEIAFSGGDGWSPGITEYSNIRLIK